MEWNLGSQGLKTRTRRVTSPFGVTIMTGGCSWFSFSLKNITFDLCMLKSSEECGFDLQDQCSCDKIYIGCQLDATFFYLGLEPVIIANLPSFLLHHLTAGK